MELGRRRPEPAAFFDDVDRAYVVRRLEGAMDAPVDLVVSRRRSSGLLLPGSTAPPAAAEEAQRAEHLARELAVLEPRIRVALVDGDDRPVFSVDSPGGGGIRFLGVPRINLFRALLDAIRRTSTADHELEEDRVSSLRQLPEPVHAQVFATPT